MDSPSGRPLLRIGELSRRLGVSDHVLRAWESRYGLLQPVRSAGGFRLYSEADEARIRRMQAYLAEGLSAAEAARAALRGDASPAAGGLASAPAAAPAGGEPFAELRRALDAFDEPAAQAVLDRLMAELSLPAVLRDVVLPYLADLGERWRRGTASIAAEHFASNLIRGRLAGLARGWGSGHGPRALLACPPSWPAPSTPRTPTWSSSPLPSHRPSSRCNPSSSHWPGTSRSPSPEPAPRRRSPARPGPG